MKARIMLHKAAQLYDGGSNGKMAPRGGIIANTQNSPNPFSASTAIQRAVHGPSNVRMAVYDFAGRLVKTLVSKYKKPDAYTVARDGTDSDGRFVASGIYFCKIGSGEYDDTLKILLLK